MKVNSNERRETAVAARVHVRQQCSHQIQSQGSGFVNVGVGGGGHVLTFQSAVTQSEYGTIGRKHGHCRHYIKIKNGCFKLCMSILVPYILPTILDP